MHQALRAGLRFYPLFCLCFPAFCLCLSCVLPTVFTNRFPRVFPNVCDLFARILAAAADFC